MSDSAIPWTAGHQAFQSFTISQNLFRFMFIESLMLSNHLILCCPFLLLSSILPSIRVFSSELAHCIRWPKYWSFSISLSNEYLGLVSFRIDWFDLLAVQGTFKNLLQYCSLEAWILNGYLDPKCTRELIRIVQLGRKWMKKGKSEQLSESEFERTRERRWDDFGDGGMKWW